MSDVLHNAIDYSPPRGASAPDRRPRTKTRWLLHLALSTGALVMLLPFLWMLSTSLKEQSEVFRYPPTLIPDVIRWQNYPDALGSLRFDWYFLNSLIVATSVTALQLFTSSLAAFAFARLRFRGRGTLFVLYLIALMVPFPVLLIPNFLIVRELGWYDSYAALILPPAFSAFSTFLLRQAFAGLPMELDDAARIDGASSWDIYARIIMPMSATTLAALAIFIFLGTWNDFLWPLVVTNSERLRTVPVGLAAFQSEFGVRWQLLMAGAVVAMLPVLIVYAIAQKWFIRGFALSGFGGR